MPIDRTVFTPIFLDYILKYCLIPKSAEVADNVTESLAGIDARWIDIPSYQRGKKWIYQLVVPKTKLSKLKQELKHLTKKTITMNALSGLTKRCTDGLTTFIMPVLMQNL